MAHDVFLSYSSKDKPIADAVCGTLEGKRIRCWIAPRDVLPGIPYGEAIESSRVMVLVFSSAANNSPQVMREVERVVRYPLVCSNCCISSYFLHASSESNPAVAPQTQNNDVRPRFYASANLTPQASEGSAVTSWIYPRPGFVLPPAAIRGRVRPMVTDRVRPAQSDECGRLTAALSEGTPGG